MKKGTITAFLFLFVLVANAQQKVGKVIYEYSTKSKAPTTVHTVVSSNGISMGGVGVGTPTFFKPLPIKYELLFGNNKMTWNKMEEQRPTEMMGSGTVSVGGGSQAIGGSDSDVLFCDLGTGINTRQRELFDKQYLLTDSVSKLTWKMSGETKTILNHVCNQAIAAKIKTRTQVSMKDGKMVKEEVADTTTMTAWYAVDIPVSAAPQEVHGQLPGLVLELEVSNMYAISTYLATELSDKVNLAAIKAPTKGKKVTTEEFNKELEKLLKQVRENGAVQMVKQEN